VNPKYARNRARVGRWKREDVERAVWRYVRGEARNAGGREPEGVRRK